jgi:hypothetical protein
LFYAVDEEHHASLFRTVSPKVSERQWEFYTNTCDRLISDRTGPANITIVISEPSSDLPHAKWRQRFADIGARARRETVFVLVTQSTLARGILTAVNWIRPFQFHYGAVATLADGITMADGWRPGEQVRPVFHALHARLAPVPR